MSNLVPTPLKIKIILLFYLIYYISYLAEGFFFHWYNSNYVWEKPGYFQGIILETLMIFISSFSAISFVSSKKSEENYDNVIDNMKMRRSENLIKSALKIVFTYCFLAVMINATNNYFFYEIYSPEKEYKFYLQMIHYFRTALLGGIILSFLYILSIYKRGYSE